MSISGAYKPQHIPGYTLKDRADLFTKNIKMLLSLIHSFMMAKSSETVAQTFDKASPFMLALFKQYNRFTHYILNEIPEEYKKEWLTYFAIRLKSTSAHFHIACTKQYWESKLPVLKIQSYKNYIQKIIDEIEPLANTLARHKLTEGLDCLSIILCTLNGELSKISETTGDYQASADFSQKALEWLEKVPNNEQLKSCYINIHGYRDQITLDEHKAKDNYKYNIKLQLALAYQKQNNSKQFLTELESAINLSHYISFELFNIQASAILHIFNVMRNTQEAGRWILRLKNTIAAQGPLLKPEILEQYNKSLGKLEDEFISKCQAKLERLSLETQANYVPSKNSSASATSSSEPTRKDIDNASRSKNSTHPK